MQNLRKLLANRVDLVLEDRNVLDYTLTAEGLTGLAEILSRYGLTDWTVGHAAALAPPPGR